MHISFMKKAAVAAATTLASAGIVLGSSTAAHATGAVDITAVSGSTVISAPTQWVSLKMAVTIDPSVTSWYADSVDVYRGGVKVGSTTDIYETGNSQLSVKLNNAWGRGAFTFRNLSISYYTGSGSGTIADNAIAGGVVVRGASNGNLSYHNAFTVKARGKTHKFAVGLSYYATNNSWRPWVGQKVSIQQYSGGHWKTVKSLKLGSKGRAAWTRKTGKKYSYRMVTSTTSSVIGGSTRGTSKL